MGIITSVSLSIIIICAMFMGAAKLAVYKCEKKDNEKIKSEKLTLMEENRILTMRNKELQDEIQKLHRDENNQILSNYISQKNCMAARYYR